jgi:hypothetical protein
LNCDASRTSSSASAETGVTSARSLITPGTVPPPGSARRHQAVRSVVPAATGRRQDGAAGNGFSGWGPAV